MALPPTTKSKWLSLNLSRPPGRYCDPYHRHPSSDALFSLKDLGKSSNDLLGKDFPINGTALDVKTATSSGVSFKVALTRDAKAAINGDLETKYNLKHHGLTLTQTWTTTNVLRTQVELENQIAKGLKFDLATALLPDKGSKSALLTAIYKQPGLHTRAFLDIFKVWHLLPCERGSGKVVTSQF